MRQDTTIILDTFDDVQQATIVLDKLKAAGINAFLENENPIGLNPLGGVELKIFSKDSARAKKIISG